MALVEEEAPTGDMTEVATEVATETASNKATSNVLGGNVLGGNVLGSDVGIKTLATCSDGTCCANPKALAAKIKQLRRWQRRLSRRVKGGKNRSKVRMKVARLHMQVANVRRDAHNKAACAIPDKRPSVLVIEELNVKGMVKNRRLARALSDAALGQFGRILP
jgi:putative transposase